MDTVRKISLVVDVVASSGSKERAKRAAREVADEVKRINAETAANRRRNNQTILEAEKELTRGLRQQVRFQEKQDKDAAREKAMAFKKAIREIEREASGGGKRAGSVFRSSFVGGLSGAAIGTAVIGALRTAFSAVPGFISEAFAKSAQFSQAQLSLAQFSGSAAAATEKLRELIKVSAATPGLSFSTAIEGQKRLQGIGFEAKTATDLLTGLAKVRILSGSSKEDMDEMLINLVQIASGGQRATQEIREMATRMHAIVGIIRKEFGGIGQELNAVKPEDFIKRLAAAMNQQRVEFASSSLAVENFGDAIDRLYVAIGAIIERNPDVIAAFNVFTGKIDDTTVALFDNETQTHKTFSALVSGIARGTIHLANFANYATAVFDDIGTVTGTVLAQVGNFAGYITQKVAITTAGMMGGLGEALNSVIDRINGIISIVNTIPGLTFGVAPLPRFETDWQSTASKLKSLDAQFATNRDIISSKYLSGTNFTQTKRAGAMNTQRLAEFENERAATAARLARQGNATYERPRTGGSTTPGRTGGGSGGRTDTREAFGSLRELRATSGNPMYDSLIVQAAKEYDIDPNILLSLAKQESGFNPKALSNKGARGITQWMPQTASRFGVNPDDVKSSLFGTARVLSQNISRFGGDEEAVKLALAGYNAGWEGKGKFGSVEERLRYFMRRVPETRDYVSKITGNYSRVLGSNKSYGSFDAEAEQKRLLAALVGRINTRPDAQIEAPSADIGPLPIERRQSVEADYITSLKEQLGIEERLTELVLRQNTVKEDTSLRIQAAMIDQDLELLDINAELAKLADAAYTKNETALNLKREELSLTRERADIESRIATFAVNSSDRIRNAALRDRLDLLEQEERATQEINRLNLEIAQKGVFSENQAQARMLDYFNRNVKGATDVMVDFKTTIADGIFEQIDLPFQKLNEKLEKLPPIIRGVATAFVNLGNDIARAFSQQFIMQLLGISPQSGMGGGAMPGGGLLGGLFGGGGGTGGGGGLLGGIFGGGGGAGGGGGIFGWLGGLFGAGGGAAAGMAGPAAGIAGGLGTGAISAAGPAGLSSIIAGGAGAGGAAAGAGGLGGLMGSMGALFTNPWTAVVAGGIIGGIVLWKMFGGQSAEKKLKKAANTAYGINIQDKSVLKQLKMIGEGTFGKGQAGKRADEVVKLDAAKDLIFSYAESTGQNTDKIDRASDFDAESPRNIYNSIKPSASQIPTPPASQGGSAGSMAASSPSAGVSGLNMTLGGLVDVLEAFTSKFMVATPDGIVLMASPAVVGDKVEQDYRDNPKRAETLARNSGGY